MEQPNMDMQPDIIVRATAHNDQLRAFACRTTGVCREAVRIHGLSPAAAAAFGRLMSGILMLAQDLDQPGDSLTAIVHSDGPIQGMTVIGEQDATVRGTVLQPVVETHYRAEGKLDIGSAVGRGTLTIIRDMRLKEPYIGRVALVSGEIAEDMATYLAVSEQIPSVVSLGVKMDRQGITHAGGLIIQLMPESDEGLAEWLEGQIADFPDVTTLLETSTSPEEILERLLGADNVRIHTRIPCAYACPCSRERMSRNLIAMGREELSALAQDEQGINLECHFCGRHYHFQKEEVQKLLALSKEV
ncbi:MAG: Hsp33 family molecular chaperone HslO [Bacillota bacterium]|nr:Hsp33 family molecular chaperone HslO [Bacillota bacterium]